MNREIKFRGVNKRTAEIIYIDDLYWFEENGVHVACDGDWHIEQFTGLHDKNGKEIYEGDVCKDQSINGIMAEVIYSDRWTEYKLVGGNSVGWYDSLEIVGNIHTEESK